MENKTRNRILAGMLGISLIAMAFIWQKYAQPSSAQTGELKVSNKQEKPLVLEGEVVAKQSAELGFVLPGRISAIKKKAGDTVKAGEVLAVQDSADIQAQLAGAKANVLGAQAVLGQQQNTLKKEKLKLKSLTGNERKIQKAQIASVEDGVNAQENAVNAAQDAVQNVQAQLTKTFLRAPFAGIITKQGAEVGEVSSASAPPFITLQSDSRQLQIEAQATELDVKRIKMGQQVQITLDALGTDKIFEAKVVAIDPAATVGKGAATYKITLEFAAQETEINAGMGANILFE